MQSSYLKRCNLIKKLFIITLSMVLIIFLYGLKDFKKDGIEYKFRARIVDIENPPPDKKVLVVKEIHNRKNHAKGKTEKIFVIINSETRIGSEGAIMKFKDLRLKMAVAIEGIKIVENDDGVEKKVVLAKWIRPLVD